MRLGSSARTLLAVVLAAACVLLLTRCTLAPELPEREAGFGLVDAEARALAAGLEIPADASVLVGAGDIARCNAPAPAAETARLVRAVIDASPRAFVLTAGDHVYPEATREALERCYGPNWGRFETRTRPTPGNHDYEVGQGVPYLDYFSVYDENAEARARGYYSYSLPGWLVVSLNSLLPMTAGSRQMQWLEDELDAAGAECILAYWHHPLFMSGRHALNPWGAGRETKRAWEILSAFGAELIVNGHEHFYARYAPQTPDGERVTEGPRQFTVGTGGGELRSFILSPANRLAAYNAGYGVLVLILERDRFRWAFLGTDGAVHDASPEPVRCSG